VISCLLDRAYSHEAVFLQGNHDVIFSQFLDYPEILGHWRQFGGLETLTSYGSKCRSRLARHNLRIHRRPFSRRCQPRTAPSSIGSSPRLRQLFLVHAGMRPSVALEAQREKDLFWIREEFLNHEGGRQNHCPPAYAGGGARDPAQSD
jgi:serine/threonine protein phosphatase 1